jgi:hypothetical protein
VTEATLPSSAFWRGQAQLDPWIETYGKDANGNAKTFYSAERNLNDPSTYYGGPKSGRIMKWGTYSLALSDRTGQLQGGTIGYTQADNDRLIRNALTNPLQYGLITAQQVIRCLLETDRIAHVLTPLVIWRGLVTGVDGKAQYQINFKGQDWLSSRIAQYVPNRILGIDFAGRQNLPAASEPLYGAIVYGDATDTVAGPPVSTSVDWLVVGGGGGGGSPSTTNGSGGGGGGKVLTGTDTLTPGAYTIVVGDGGISAGSAAPGGDGADSSFNGHDAPGGKGGPGVTGVGGQSGSGEPGGTPADAEDGGGGGGDSGPGGNSSPGVGGAGGPGTRSGINGSAGGTVYGTGGGGSASVGGTPGVGGPMGDGVGGVWSFGGPQTPATSGAPNTGDGGGGAENNQNSGAGGSGIVILRYLTGTGTSTGGNVAIVGPYTIVTFLASGTFTLGASATGAAGTIPAIDVGDFVDAFGQTWGGFAIAAHAMYSLEENAVLRDVTNTVVTADGVLLDIPGYNGFNTRWGTTYRDVPTGARYTLAYATGSTLTALRGSSKLYVNGGGVETVGDGSGTLLTMIEDQIAHFFDNYVGSFPSYVGGLWVTSPPSWSDGASKRDVASFTQYTTSANGTFQTVRTSAWIVLAQTLMTDQLARLMVLADATFAFTREGQFRIVLDLPNYAPPSPVANYTEVSEFLEDSFNFTLDTTTSFFWNTSLVSSNPGWDQSGSITYATSTTISDAQSLSDHGLQQNPATLEIAGIVTSARAAEIMARQLLRAKNPTLMATGDVGLIGLLPHLGDYVTAVHREAPWPSRRLLMLRTWSPDLDNQKVTLQCYDADAFSPSVITDMLAGYLAYLMGDPNEQVVAASYPSGATGDKLHHGSLIWPVDSANLPGTYRMDLMGLVVSGQTVYANIFNLTDAPDTPMLGTDVQITAQVPTFASSGLISFPASGASKNYGIKTKVTGGGPGFIWGVGIKRVS